MRIHISASIVGQKSDLEEFGRPNEKLWDFDDRWMALLDLSNLQLPALEVSDVYCPRLQDLLLGN